MPLFIDTHTHLFLSEFDDDRRETMQRAVDAGITKLFMPNVDTSTIQALNNACNEFHEQCFPMMGLHPSSVTRNYKNDLEIIKQQFNERKYYAVGEIGIDLYWEKTYKQQQINAFTEQVQWAEQVGLPIVIHSRNALSDIFEILDSLQISTLTGIFHCFGGSVEEAQRAIEMGFKIGIGGVVTFKNAGMQKVVANIDLEHIVLETDSPYLAPVPKRGKRNESAYIPYITQKVADIKQTSLDNVAEITTKNALKVFNLKI